MLDVVVTPVAVLIRDCTLACRARCCSAAAVEAEAPRAAYSPRSFSSARVRPSVGVSPAFSTSWCSFSARASSLALAVAASYRPPSESIALDSRSALSAAALPVPPWRSMASVKAAEAAAAAWRTGPIRLAESAMPSKAFSTVARRFSTFWRPSSACSTVIRIAMFLRDPLMPSSLHQGAPGAAAPCLSLRGVQRRVDFRCQTGGRHLLRPADVQQARQPHGRHQDEQHLHGVLPRLLERRHQGARLLGR